MKNNELGHGLRLHSINMFARAVANILTPLFKATGVSKIFKMAARSHSRRPRLHPSCGGCQSKRARIRGGRHGDMCVHFCVCVCLCVRPRVSVFLSECSMLSHKLYFIRNDSSKEIWLHFPECSSQTMPCFVVHQFCALRVFFSVHMT